MAKTYIENIKLTAIRNKLFSNLVEKEYINIFDVLTLSSGDFLPIQKMINGEYSVFGGGGITDKKHNEFNIHNNTLGIGRVGARCGCVFKIPANSWATDNALYANKIDDNFDMEFLIHYLNFKNLLQYANTSAQPVISLKRISPIKIPFLSLQEQKEIVKILDDVENGIVGFKNDKYEIKGTFNIINSKEDISSELTHQLDLIKQLRQSFLREAMQGKLVKSTNTKETGQKLLAKIKAEKAELIAEKKLKKEKELPPISEDEIPFKIPDHWAWCRLGETIYDTDSGKSPNCLNQPVIENQWGVIKTTAVQEMFFLENENKILPEKFIVNEQHKICEGDILITRAGPKNRVGIVCCVEKLTRNLILSDKTIRIKFSKKILSAKYFTIALNSPLIKKLIEKKMTGMADSQVNITQNNIKSFPIPLPPLHEQEQIVTKLEELMRFCDGLELNIKGSQSYNEQLLQQVLREALQPKKQNL